MALVAAKCTNCGGNIVVDNTKETGICESCGSAFITEKVIQNITNVTNNVTNNSYAGATINVQGGPKLENMLELGRRAKEAKKYEEAIKYYSQALELDTNNLEALFYSRQLDVEKLLENADEYFEGEGKETGKIYDPALEFRLGKFYEKLHQPLENLRNEMPSWMDKFVQTVNSMEPKNLEKANADSQMLICYCKTLAAIEYFIRSDLKDYYDYYEGANNPVKLKNEIGKSYYWFFKKVVELTPDNPYEGFVAACKCLVEWSNRKSQAFGYAFRAFHHDFWDLVVEGKKLAFQFDKEFEEECLKKEEEKHQREIEANKRERERKARIEEEKRKQEAEEAERRKEEAKRKRIKTIITIAVVLAIIIGIVIAFAAMSAETRSNVIGVIVLIIIIVCYRAYKKNR